MSLLAHTFGIFINKKIGAPSHGKDEVDILNLVENNYLLIFLLICLYQGKQRRKHKFLLTLIHQQLMNCQGWSKS